MVEGEVKHSGRIVGISPTGITVEIISESACSSCHAASLCGMSESRRKLVDVPLVEGYEVGEEVWINLKRAMGMKAVWIAYVMPLIILIAGVLVLSSLGLSEIMTGAVSLALICVYYFGVYLFRDKLRTEYNFYIQKK